MSRQAESGGVRVAAAAVATVLHVYLYCTPRCTAQAPPRPCSSLGSPYGTGYVAERGVSTVGGRRSLLCFAPSVGASTTGVRRSLFLCFAPSAAPARDRGGVPPPPRPHHAPAPGPDAGGLRRRAARAGRGPGTPPEAGPRAGAPGESEGCLWGAGARLPAAPPGGAGWMRGEGWQGWPSRPRR